MREGLGRVGTYWLKRSHALRYVDHCVGGVAEDRMRRLDSMRGFSVGSSRSRVRMNEQQGVTANVEDSG